MISIVIPAYNESKNIADTIHDISLMLRGIEGVTSFEIIVIDDHSTDETFEKIIDLNLDYVKVIRLSQRRGSNLAIRAGMREAKGNAVMYLSADGQDNPVAIPEMIKKWRAGGHVVWALRHSRQDEPWHVKLPALIFYKILRVTSTASSNDVDVSRADFCLMDRLAVDAINSCDERNTSLFGLIVWCGFNQQSVEYERMPRRNGNSKWSFSTRLKLAKDWIITFSGLPLMVIEWIGFITPTISLLYVLVILFSYFLDGPVTDGGASIKIAILILGSLNVILTGLVGECVWRTLDESRKRPLYFIEKKYSGKESNK